MVGKERRTSNLKVFHITHTKNLLRTTMFRIQGIPMNNLAAMRNCSVGYKVG